MTWALLFCATDIRLPVQGEPFGEHGKQADRDIGENILILQETGKKREKNYNRFLKDYCVCDGIGGWVRERDRFGFI